jgi:hypothetical protein
MFKYGFELSRRADPLTARELVDLGCHDGCGIDCVPQPGPGFEVALQAGVSGVDQQKGANFFHWRWGPTPSAN